jgi:hypothetical protein
MHCTSLSKPGVSDQAAALSSRKSASLPLNEHENAFWHQEIHFIRYSELGFWSHTGLNLACGKIATFSGDVLVLTYRPGRNMPGTEVSLFCLCEHCRRFIIAGRSWCCGSRARTSFRFYRVIE